jgi:putative membrane protein
VTLALQVARFDIEAAHNAHHSIELTEVGLGQVTNSAVISLGAVVDDEGSIGRQQSQGVLGVRHGSNLAAQRFLGPSVSHNGFLVSPSVTHSALVFRALTGHHGSMFRFLVRLAVNSIALAIAVWIVPGLTMVPYAEGEPIVVGGPSLELVLSYLFIALVFGLINGIIGNAIRIVAFPLYVITLGLIALVVNGLLLLLVTLVSTWLTFGLFVQDYYWGIVGALVLSLSAWIIGMLLRPLTKQTR